MAGLLACTSSGATDAANGIDEAHPLAMFPSDRFTRPDDLSRTGLRMALPANIAEDEIFAAFPELAAELESLDGFGTSAPLWIRFMGPLDPGSLPSEEESVSAHSPIQLIHLATGRREAFNTHFDVATNTLFLLPTEVLEPGTRYAFVLTDRLRAMLGGKLRPAALWQSTEITVAGAIATSIFTTQSTTEGLGLLALREVEHGPVEFPAATTACTDFPDVGWTGKGLLRSPDYRTEEDRFPVALDDRQPPEGTAKEAWLPYIIVLPKNAPAAPMVIVQHGLANHKERTLLCSTAQQYAAHGFATIAIDAAWHGERGPNGDRPSLLSYLRVLFGVGIDGEKFTARLRYGRDALRQTALDHVQLAALVRAMAAEMDADADTDLDLSGDVFYNGASMGGIIGSLTTAIAADIPASVLNVPGGRLSNLLFQSEMSLFDAIASPVLETRAGLAPGDVRRFVALFQVIAERADPINYARHWWHTPLPERAPKSVIVQETVDDILVPNRTTEDLARAGYLPQLLPAIREVAGMEQVLIPPSGLRLNLAPTVSGGMVQLEMVTVDGELQKAPHATMQNPEGLNQAATFFRGWVDGAAEIRRIY